MSVSYLDYTGYLNVQEVLKELENAKADRGKIPVERDENEAYNIGKALGVIDGLKLAMEIIASMPKEPIQRLIRTERNV